jgi:hypothetical protein
MKKQTSNELFSNGSSFMFVIFLNGIFVIRPLCNHFIDICANERQGTE